MDYRIGPARGMIFAIILVLWISLPAGAVERRSEWTTEKALSTDLTLRYHWAGGEGFERITRVDAIWRREIIKSLFISGQPVFNPEMTRIAFPDCRDTGCSRIIRIVDLSTLSELSPILFDQDTYLFVRWEPGQKLVVNRMLPSRDGKSEIRIFDIR